MKLQLFKRLENRDGVNWCFCSGHSDWHPCDEFYLGKHGHGYQYHCKPYLNKIQHFGVAPKENDLVIAREMLSRMGYDINSDKTIHQQFLNKHDL